MRPKLVLPLILLITALLLASTPLLAGQDDVTIKDGSYEMLGISPKGTNVTWGWKVRLSNDVPERHSVLLTVQLLDGSGYEVDKATKRVRLDSWETKTVTGQRKLHSDLWEKVTRASYTLEVTK